MRIAVPAVSDEGLSACVSDHFGSAPFFVIFDTDTREVTVIGNSVHAHVHGACNPVGALRDARTDSVLCRGMGMRAVSLFQGEGIPVYRSDKHTAGEMLAAWEQGEKSLFSADDGCSGHGCR